MFTLTLNLSLPLRTTVRLPRTSEALRQQQCIYYTVLSILFCMSILVLVSLTMGSATYKNLGGHNAQVTTDKYSIEYILYTSLRILVREIISKTFYP